MGKRQGRATLWRGTGNLDEFGHRNRRGFKKSQRRRPAYHRIRQCNACFAELRRLNRSDESSVYPEALVRITLDLRFLPEGEL